MCGRPRVVSCRGAGDTPVPHARTRSVPAWPTWLLRLGLLSLASTGTWGFTAHRTVAAQAEDAGPVLAFGGDVIFDAPIEYALRRTGSARDAASSYAPIFEDVAPVLAAADLAIVNLETPVAERTRSRSEEHEVPTFAAPDAFLAALAAAGIDVVGVANNHAYDQGVLGLGQTLAAARTAGLEPVGAGESARAAGAASIVRVRGLEVALLQFSEATNWRVMDEEADAPRIALLSDDAVESHVRAARASGAALVVASFHWSDGRDPDHVPSAHMRSIARLAANAGADLVVGHGTHLPAGSEVLVADGGRAVPVLWSLGNLAAVMEAGEGEVFGEGPSVRDAWIARVRTEPDGAGRLRVRAIEIVPFWIDVSRAEGSLPFVRPLELERERGAVRAAACGALCERIEAALLARGERAASFAIVDARVRAEGGAAGSERDGALVARADVPARDEREPAPDAPRHAEPAAPYVPVGAAPETDPSDPSSSISSSGLARVETEAAGAPAPRSSAAADADASGSARPRRRSTERVPPELARGIELRITFAGGGDHETAIDEAQLGPIVERLRSDRDLHAEVIAHPSAAEPDRALASRRARRVRGLIAVRGPSRSHLDSRVGAIADHAYLELRVWR